MYIKIINEDKVKLLIEDDEIQNFEKINFCRNNFGVL